MPPPIKVVSLMVAAESLALALAGVPASEEPVELVVGEKARSGRLSPLSLTQPDIMSSSYRENFTLQIGAIASIPCSAHPAARRAS